jgi:hypothetical protein
VGITHTKCLWILHELVGKGRFRFIGFSLKIRGEADPGGGIFRGAMAEPAAFAPIRGRGAWVMLDIVIKGGDKGMAIYGKTPHQYRRHTAHDE